MFVIDRQTNNVRRAPRPPVPRDGGARQLERAVDLRRRQRRRVHVAGAHARRPPPTPRHAHATAVILFATGPPEPFVYAWDCRTEPDRAGLAQQPRRTAAGRRQPSISATGRFIAYTTALDAARRRGRRAPTTSLRFDRRTEDTVLVSVGFDGGPSVGGRATRRRSRATGRWWRSSPTAATRVVHEDTGQRAAGLRPQRRRRARTEQVSKAADGGRPRRPGERARDLAGRPVRRVHVLVDQPRRRRRARVAAASSGATARPAHDRAGLASRTDGHARAEGASGAARDHRRDGAMVAFGPRIGDRPRPGDRRRGRARGASCAARRTSSSATSAPARRC